jgi:2,3-bisphosphoglycerate-independent phosphoglycerate mutase
MRQLHVAETEKFAHVTFFLNGTIDEPFPGEDRLLNPSPHVSNYAEATEMSAIEISKETVKAIDSNNYDFIILNFANADMVGHTGDMTATIKGCETIDKCLGDIIEHVLAKNGAVVITADHGNGEELVNLQTGQLDKEHSNNSVPCIIVAQDLLGQAGPAGDPPEGDLSLLPPIGMLADVAPTVLKLMGLEQPNEMTGQSLI